MRLHSPAVRNLVVLVLFMAGAVLAITTLSARRERVDLAQVAIDHSRARADAELKRFFQPVEANLFVARDWGEAGQLDLEDPEALNARFIPILESIPQATSLLIGNTRGEEYLLLRDGTTWRNRLTRAEARPGVVRWLRWSRDGRLLEDADQPLDYDGRTRPWFTGALAADGTTAHWTDPYLFFTTKDPGITTSIKWHGGLGDDATWVVALDVMLVDVSAFTSGIQVGRSGKLVVLDEALALMGLPRDPRFDDRASFRGWVLEPAATLGLPELDGALRAWTADGMARRTYRADQGWWSRIYPFELGDRTLWIAALVPEDDFAGRANRVRNLIIVATVVALFLALAMALLLDHAYQLRLQAAVAEVRQLGQYTLEEKLGSGGMGEVYRASHALLRRPTAVKLLNGASILDEVAVERFEREVQLTASLTHPNTIAIYDYGRTPEGVFYYAMEYVAGIDLDQLVDLEGPLPAERVVHLLSQVCGSLAEAHGAGLVHRDIKPANVMICERGGRHDVVKVLDFGLVTDLVHEDYASRASSVIGTPRYMAPEAIENPARLDARADLYAVGAIGAYLLTGHHAVQGATVAEITAAHLAGEVRAPSAFRPVPADLEAVLMACLARQPADRPTSALELAARLQACDCAGDWDEDRAAAWWRRFAPDKTAPRAEVTHTEHTFAMTIDLTDRNDAQSTGRAEV